jgi:hypothetical protein
LRRNSLVSKEELVGAIQQAVYISVAQLSFIDVFLLSRRCLRSMFVPMCTANYCWVDIACQGIMNRVLHLWAKNPQHILLILRQTPELSLQNLPQMHTFEISAQILNWINRIRATAMIRFPVDD